MLTSVIDGVDSFLDAIGSSLKQGIGDYCDLETADDRHTIVARDGSLLSIVQMEGMRSLVTPSNLLYNVVEPLTTSMRSMFEQRAHQVQVWFEVDHDRTQAEIAHTLEPARTTAAALGMDMDDLLTERENNISKHTASERCFLVLWTLPSALTKVEVKREKDSRKEAVKGKVMTANAQDPMRGNVMLRNRHLSFVDAFTEELGRVGVVASKLKVHDALREVRRSIDPGFTSPDWQPSLPGDKTYPAQRKNLTSRQKWEVLWAPMGRQLAPRDAVIKSENAVEIGDRIYAPIYVDLFPKEPDMFASLFERTRSKRLPWRISFLIEGGGLSGFGFKQLISSLLGFVPNNKMISSAIKDLREMQQHGEIIIQGRIALCTWAPAGEMELLQRRQSDLARSIEPWGSCQVSEITGDPMAGVASSALAFTKGSIATKTAAPMEDVMYMMPWNRPCSPWATGAVTWCSPDGKLMPYQPYSSIQASWINLIFARPGSGKSVLMNMMNLALVMSPGLTRLPRIAVIDVGPSSSGLISLLRDALPTAQKHQVVHRRLRMTESNAINPFDTQLGCRIPTAIELMFLRNFVSLLVTDIEKDTLEQGMPGLVSEVIREMYLRKSDSETPNRYSVGISRLVDDSLGDIAFNIDAQTTWWEVVDALFESGNIYAARVAQRYAVPLLADAVGAANSERVRSTYGAMTVSGTGEKLINAFSRMITESLGYFPILARPTAFDVADASVVALDLDEVAKSGGKIAQRVSAVMYMLARQVLGKDFYINEDSVSEMPAPDNMSLRPSVPRQAYKSYHKERIRELKEVPKRICYDEFHRTWQSPVVREQVVLDMREGRKFRVDIILASQDLSDFDEQMVRFATGLFVMDGGNESVVNEICQQFGFSEGAETYALRHRLRAPYQGRPGIFMGQFQTSLGKYTTLLQAPLGPIELWAFSTTALDVAIRTRLYDRMGASRARRALAAIYPRGSAVSDIEHRQENMRTTVGILDDSANNNILEQIAKEVEEAAHTLGI